MSLYLNSLFFFRALTKEVDIGLSIQKIENEVIEEFLVQGGAVSPIITIEPRRRKFHKAITITMPLPEKIPHYNGRPTTFQHHHDDNTSSTSATSSRKTSLESASRIHLGELPSDDGDVAAVPGGGGKFIIQTHVLTLLH